MKETRNALFDQTVKLKSSCLLLDGDDGTYVRIHDLVRDVAHTIANKDIHVLVEDGGHERKRWSNEDFLIEYSRICLSSYNIAILPQVHWECPKLEMFHLHGDDDDDPGDDNDDSSPKIPNKFFEEMRNLKLLGLNYVSLLPLPSSFPVLKNLQTLCLDGCRFKDTALIGELRTLEVLGMVNSDVEKLPKEIGRLTRLWLVDLSDCYRLEVIPARVISNWKRLEDLRLRNSFKELESGEVMSETSNATWPS